MFILAHARDSLVQDALLWAVAGVFPARRGEMFLTSKCES